MKKEWKRKLSLPAAGLLALCLAAPLHAEEESNVFTLGEIVVKEKGETITGVTTVEEVNTEEMEEINATNVADALETLPGVYTNLGGRRNEASLNVRGFGQRYVPLFLDGIPMYVPYDGYVDTAELSINNLSKVTLTKGTASVLYGPNTMGGVINLVSKRPTEKLEGNVSLEWRDGDTTIANVSVGTRQGDWYLQVSGGILDSDGFLLSDDYDATAGEDGDLRENSDLEEKNYNVKVGWTPADGHEYAIGVQSVDREKGLPSSADGSKPWWRFTDWDKDTYYFIGDSKITDNLSTSVRIYHDTYYNVLDSYDDDTYTTQTMKYTFHSTYDDYSNGASVTARLTYIPKNTLSLAAHYKNDIHKSQSDTGDAWEKDEMTTLSFAAEDDFKINDVLSMVFGLSYDTNELEGAGVDDSRDDKGAFNPQIGVLWNATETMDVHASVSRKSRFPSLKELYSSFIDGDVKPNPDLEEERATNFEVGLSKYLTDETTVSAALFYSKVDDLIEEMDIDDPVYESQLQNIDESSFKGVELSATTTIIPHNRITANYTYLDAQNESADRTSDYLPNQSEHKFYLSDSIDFTNWLSLFTKIEYNSKRYYEGDDGWESLDGFWLVDAKLIWTTPVAGLTVEGGFKNLFDENYEYNLYYPQAGRTLFAKMQYKF